MRSVALRKWLAGLAIAAAIAAIVVSASLAIASPGGTPDLAGHGNGKRATQASCVGLTRSEQRAAAKMIVIGRMLSGPSTRIKDRRVLLSPAMMRVGRYLKGSGRRTIEVQTGVRLSSGQMRIEEDGILPSAGQRWEILSSSRQLPLRTSACLGSRRLPPATKRVSGFQPAPPEGYGIEIQAIADNAGDPVLVANFSPDGAPATPAWAICRSPDRHACTPARPKIELVGELDAGHQPVGTVFQATATYNGHTYSRAPRPGREPFERPSRPTGQHGLAAGATKSTTCVSRHVALRTPGAV
jgi:hypothetical protein